MVVVKSTLLVHKLNCMLPEYDEDTSCESNPKAIQACLLLYYAKSCRECNYLSTSTRTYDILLSSSFSPGLRTY